MLIKCSQPLIKNGFLYVTNNDLFYPKDVIDRKCVGFVSAASANCCYILSM